MQNEAKENLQVVHVCTCTYQGYLIIAAPGGSTAKSSQLQAM